MTPPAADSSLIERLRAATSGEYEIVRELGRGGFATVYLGRDLALERDVAIKVLTALDEDADSSGEIERFRREARTAGRLSHPNIIPIHAVRSNGGLQYFVMKFVRGRPLDGVLKDTGALPLALVQTILKQVGSALAHAHRHGVVHRDVKPANIMLDEDGWAVVADFGIAQVARAEKLTATGMIIGTAAYMSPEQWAGQDVTGLSDEYSLGVVGYELLTGRTPFDGTTVPALLWSHLNELPAPITNRRPDCPPALDRAVRRMLEKEPAARWPSLDDAVTEIASLPLPESPDETRTKLISLAAVGMTAAPVTGTAPASASPVMPSSKVTRLAVSPASADVLAGASLRLEVSATNATGQPLARRAVAWRSLDPSVATVDADGVVTARGPGTTTITAACEGAEVTVRVAVAGARPEVARQRRRVRVAGAAVAVALLAAAVLWRQGTFDALGGTTDSTGVFRRLTFPGRAPPKPADTTGTSRGVTTAGGVSVPHDTARTKGSPIVPLVSPGGAAPVPKDSSPPRPIAAAPPAVDPAAAAPGPVVPTADNTSAANPVVDVSAGGTATCAAMSNGTDVLCWGGESPAGALLSGGFYFSKLAVGGGHICGLTPDGVAYCWGDNAQGQLGDGSSNTRATPTEVKAPVRFVSISVGAAHSCALSADGSAYCWGANKFGQLGDNSLKTRTRPVLVLGREGFQALSAGGSHTCGVSRTNKAYCWGDGFSGQIGNAMQEMQREPFPVKGELSFRTIVTGERHTCGLTASGRAWCWGDNSKGQLGNETRDDRNVPDSVATALVFTQLSAGAGHTCGVTSARALACWGENSSGQVGDGTRARREAPVLIARGTAWKHVSAGAAHTCAISRADAVLCWGANTRGQVGSGSAGAIAPLPAPIKVTGRAN